MKIARIRLNLLPVSNNKSSNDYPTILIIYKTRWREHESVERCPTVKPYLFLLNLQQNLDA